MRWSGIRILSPYVSTSAQLPISLSDCYGCTANLNYKKMPTLKATDYVSKTVCPANGRAAENYRLILWALEPMGCAAKYILINHRIKRSMWAIRSKALQQIKGIVGKQVKAQYSPKTADTCQYTYLACGSHFWQAEHSHSIAEGYSTQFSLLLFF